MHCGYCHLISSVCLGGYSYSSILKHQILVTLSVVMQLYIEGYLQAMLDTLYKQEYLRVRVIDNQVTKNYVLCACVVCAFQRYAKIKNL